MIKRYNIGVACPEDPHMKGGIAAYEDPQGEWIKFEELDKVVKDFVEHFKRSNIVLNLSEE